MDASESVVTGGGLALAALVGWYFFLSDRQTTAAVSSVGGVQEVALP